MEDPTQAHATAVTKAKTPEEFDRAARSALAHTDALNEKLIPEFGLQLACRAGCSLCCWLRVDAYAHEIFLIARHIRARFTPEALAALTERLALHREQVLPLTPFEHATRNIACPLLQDGRCSVYSVRPHACRRQHSLDFDACQFTYDHPEDLEFPGSRDGELFQTIGAAMQEGQSAYGKAGYDAHIYELGTALAEALENPATWRRWKDGKKTFLKASITPAA